MPGAYPPAFILSRGIILARDLSIFVDESGDRGGKARYYLLLFDHLDFFQAFDDVKVYYDNGQDIVKKALDQSFGFALSKGVLERRKTSMTDYRLEQAADYLCAIELAAIKYAAKEDGETYNKFLGGIGPFKKNWLKQARRKAILRSDPRKRCASVISSRAATAIASGTVKGP